MGETNRLAITEESYNAKMHYAKTTRRIDILMKSLGVGTRASYIRSRRHWLDFRKGENSRFG